MSHGINRGSGIFALVLALGPSAATFPLVETEATPVQDIRIQDLKSQVYRLASGEFLGRRGAGAARASRYVAAAFQRLHVQPAFGDSYFQPIPMLAGGDGVKDSFIGRNVGAVLPGTDPERKEEWILLSAHYDHLGKIGDVLYPGADDNASGVAMLLQVAERLAHKKEKPRRTVLFVAFDQEEAGLLGSTYFAAHPPRDLKNLKAFLTADMLGRSMGNVMDEYVFALGSESAPQLRLLLEEVQPPQGLKVGRIGADLVGTRSDYGPFRDRRVPFLFFSTGQHPDYHKPTDLPERINYAKLRKICLWIRDLTWRLANDLETPVWNGQDVAPDLDEARTVFLLLSRVLDRPQACPITDKQRAVVRSARERLAGIMERGQVTAGERTWLVWTARLMLMTVF